MTIEEALPEPANPVRVDGIEFVEYATSRPQEFGALLQKLGFAAVARHRSREAVLYRQGGMNLIVNAQLSKRSPPWRCACVMPPSRALGLHVAGGPLT